MIDVNQSDNIHRRTDWTYNADGSLDSMKVHDFPRILSVSGNASIANHEVREGSDHEADASTRQPKSMACVYHSGGRKIDVQFGNSGCAEIPFAIPTRIHVVHAAAQLTEGILREAHLLAVRPISAEEALKCDAIDWDTKNPTQKAIAELTGPHWQTGFRGMAAQKDLNKFCEFADSVLHRGDTAPLSSRAALTGRLLEIAVYRHENAETHRWLAPYLLNIRNSPLRKYQYELGVWLLRRVDSHGTQMIYNSIVQKFAEHAAATMSTAEQLDSILHISRLQYAPHAFFQWAIAATADPSSKGSSPTECLRNPRKGMSPQQRALRAVTAASLLPAFRRIQRSTDKGRSAYLEYDCRACSEIYTELEIAELANATRYEVQQAINLAEPETRQLLKGALHAIQLYTDPATVFESFSNQTSNPEQKQ